jgi:hypothetical protein
MSNPYAFEHTSTGTLQFPTGGMLPKALSPFHSPELNEIFAALAKAQAIIQNPEKNAKNPHFKSRYTTLDVGLTAVREALAAHGIAIFQRTYMNDKLLMVQTVLGHSSGQWLSSEYPVIMYPAKPQEAMSALTYSRRASLFAAAGIAGEDDDGNSIAKIEIDPSPEPTAPMSIIVRNMMLKELASCTNLKELATWSAKHGANKSKLTADDKAFVTTEFETLQKHLKEANNG